MNYLRGQTIPPSTAEIDRRARVARRNNMTGQQDADEFQKFLFAGIESSMDATYVHSAINFSSNHL
jgi:hypothetical protein